MEMVSGRYPRFDFNEAALDCSSQDEVSDSQSRRSKEPQGV